MPILSLPIASKLPRWAQPVLIGRETTIKGQSGRSQIEIFNDSDTRVGAYDEARAAIEKYGLPKRQKNRNNQTRSIAVRRPKTP